MTRINGLIIGINNDEHSPTYINVETIKRQSLITITFYMEIEEQSEKYISEQSEPKKSEFKELHVSIWEIMLKCKL